MRLKNTSMKKQKHALIKQLRQVGKTVEGAQVILID